MSSTETNCHCSAKLRPDEWALHQRRYHSSRSTYACGDCAFYSANFSDFVGHSFLDGHQLHRSILPKTASDNIQFGLPVPYKKDSVRVETTSPPSISENVDAGKTPKSVSSMEPGQPNVQSAENMEHEAEFSALRVTEVQSPPVLTCSKCGASPKCSSSNARYTVIVNHVRSCLGIRPYACSGCGQLSTQAQHTRSHIKGKCPSAAVVTVGEERCQAALRQGLQKCFPGVNISVGSGPGRRIRT